MTNKLHKKEISKIIATALNEDAAKNDITSNLYIDHSSKSSAVIICKSDAVVCGLNIAKHIFKTVDRRTNFKSLKKEGQLVKKGAHIAQIKGLSRSILTAERTVLNFLSHLSGIATLTHTYAQKIKSSKAILLDTRKTTPGLRILEKYAVRCGGGVNHRFNLNEMIMIKDNHIAASNGTLSLDQRIQYIRKRTNKPIILEVDHLSQLKDAMQSRIDIILLDNFNLNQFKKAISFRKKMPAKYRPLFEASGGITLNNIASIAKTGVERISVGTLTHSHAAINLSLEITSP